jgi:hypothetical protein
LETPHRSNKEDITRATFTAKPNFPNTRARIDYYAIFCAVEGMPARGLVMRRCLYHTGTGYARRVGRACRRSGGCVRCP